MNATKVVNQKSKPGPDAVYIGRRNRQHPRGSRWGNPYKLTEYSIEEALAKYATYFDHLWESDKEFREETIKLYGKTLVCYCKPAPCHGDIIAERLERYMRSLKGETKAAVEVAPSDPPVEPRADAAEQGLVAMVKIGSMTRPDPEEVMAVEPGESFRLTAAGEPEDSFIHVMGLRNKLLFTGGAHLVDAIPGSDWDPQIRIQGEEKRQEIERYDPKIGILLDRVNAAATAFFKTFMVRPNVVSLSLDFQHLGKRRIAGYMVVYGHQPMDEVNCFYMPKIGEV